jgi:hypothetical protein
MILYQNLIIKHPNNSKDHLKNLHKKLFKKILFQSLNRIFNKVLKLLLIQPIEIKFKIKFIRIKFKHQNF